jgi:uncharacterized protein (DUF362 family)
MDRREFLKNGLLLGLATSSSLAGNISQLLAQENATMPDLVAIKDGSPEAMFDAGIKAFGGMEKFVKKGQTVVVKPNIGWDQTPQLAANTNPMLVQRIVEHCFTAGAKKVYVFDHTCNDWKKCYRNSGIEEAAQKAGATLAPANQEKYYQAVDVPGAKTLHTTKLHELILEADAFINVPILKHHGGARLTIAMKNLMGIVWDRKFWHSSNLHECIADFPLLRKPTLNIVDAYRMLMRNGPRGGSEGDVIVRKMQMISSDIVAIDAAATKVFGMEPQAVPYIKMAHDYKLGNMNLEQLNIKRISL